MVRGGARACYMSARALRACALPLFCAFRTDRAHAYARACTHAAMAPLYESLIAKGLVPADAAALEKMKAENAAKLSAFDTATAEAREKFGDMEVYEQQKGKADYLVRIGDKVCACTCMPARECTCAQQRVLRRMLFAHCRRERSRRTMQPASARCPVARRLTS